jgi:ATP-dependent DNA helicase RecG
LITEAFYLTGDIEKYGTGFKRIFEWLQDYPSVKLSIPENNDIFCVELISGKTDLKTDLKTQTIISLIKMNPKITVQEIASHINKGITVTKTYLTKLKKQGVLSRIGPAKGGSWKINE